MYKHIDNYVYLCYNVIYLSDRIKFICVSVSLTMLGKF